MPKVCVEFDPQSPSEPSVQTFSTLVGDGVQTQFTIRHNLGAEGVMVQAYEEQSGEVIVPDALTLSDSNTAVIRFDTPPALRSVRVHVVGVRPAE